MRAIDPLTYAGGWTWAVRTTEHRLNQLLGSFGIFTFQYAQHQDRYATKPVGYDRPGILDYTVSPDGSSSTTAISPENPAYPPGYGPVFGPTGNNRGSRQNYGGAFTAYLGNHEVKLGGDYQDDKTRGATYYTGQSLAASATVPERVSEPGRHELLRSLEGAPVAESKRRHGAGLLSAHVFSRRGPRTTSRSPRPSLSTCRPGAMARSSRTNGGSPPR